MCLFFEDLSHPLSILYAGFIIISGNSVGSHSQRQIWTFLSLCSFRTVKAESLCLKLVCSAEKSGQQTWLHKQQVYDQMVTGSINLCEEMESQHLSRYSRSGVLEQDTKAQTVPVVLLRGRQTGWYWALYTVKCCNLVKSTDKIHLKDKFVYFVRKPREENSSLHFLSQILEVYLGDC